MQLYLTYVFGFVITVVIIIITLEIDHMGKLIMGIISGNYYSYNKKIGKTEEMC